MDIINIRGLSKYYKLYGSPKDRLKEALSPVRKVYHKKFFALRDIDLSVREGEILGIVGRNGSGKSTLLKVISGVLQPSSGKADIRGEVTALLELGSGFNPQFTGRDNIIFKGTILGFSPEEMKEKTREIIDFAEVGEFIDQPLKTYSSGMKSRLAFAVSTVMEPEILILDEVLSVGDDLFKRKCFARMEQLMSGGRTILFVSHSVNAIRQMCTRAVLLERGRLILEGSPKFVTTQYERLLFAPPAKHPDVLKEICAMKEPPAEQAPPGKPAPSPKKEMLQKVKESRQRPAPTPDDDEPYYLENLKPKSTKVISNGKIIIKNPGIFTLEDKKVNVLLTGNKYYFQYEIECNQEVTNPLFSFKIIEEKGVKLTGVRSDDTGKEIPNYLPEGSTLRVRWYFDCHLLLGSYYITTGFAQIINDEITMLKKIEDFFTFKVKKSDNISPTGYITLNQKLELEYKLNA
ncbi:MAG: ABC transporter ATP-binding protein [Candidatus Kapaibacterium sp.]